MKGFEVINFKFKVDSATYFIGCQYIQSIGLFSISKEGKKCLKVKLYFIYVSY